MDKYSEILKKLQEKEHTADNRWTEIEWDLYYKQSIDNLQEIESENLWEDVERVLVNQKRIL